MFGAWAGITVVDAQPRRQNHVAICTCHPCQLLYVMHIFACMLGFLGYHVCVLYISQHACELSTDKLICALGNFAAIMDGL
jgi:hypothetical protein